MTHPILCPIDFGPASLAAFELAASEAKRRGSPLDLLHVWEPVIGYSNEGPPLPFSGEMPTERIEDDLKSLCCDLPEDQIRVHVTSGKPADDISRMALDLDSELVVMGTHARHGLSRWIVGSVCDVVLRECPCPVLVCRGPTKSD